MMKYRAMQIFVTITWFSLTIISSHAFTTMKPVYRIHQYTTSIGLTIDAEDISKNRSRGDKQNDDNNENTKNYFEDSWIPTASGGFLPNFARRNKQKLTDNTFTRHTNKVPIQKQQQQDYPSSSIETNTVVDRSFTNEPKQDINIGNHVHEVLSIQDYKKVVVDEKDKIVVVRFYATWCRACKAISFRFRNQLPMKFPDIKFVEVPLTKENAFLHQGLGVPSLPYAHIYHPDVGLVDERKISQRIFTDFVDVLQTYKQGSCDINEKYFQLTDDKFTKDVFTEDVFTEDEDE